MANRLYREEAYLEKLELLLRTAKELAACRAQLEALDRRGVPEGSVIFSRPVKRYRRKNGEETVYLIDGQIVCRECLGDFAERYFASDAVKGERLKRGGNTYETY